MSLVCDLSHNITSFIVILENMCVEITSKWYIDSVIKVKKTIGICRPSAICRNMFCSNWVTRKGWKDVSVQNVQINNYSCVKKGKKKNSNLYKGYKLFLSEDWFEVIRINCGIASIPFFRVNILLSSENIQFGTKITRTEPNDKVELRKVLGPPHQYYYNLKTLK